MDLEKKWLLKEKYNGVESAAFHADLELLSKGVPLAYLIGSVPFLGCTIYLNSRPLIPRPETEFWTEKAIKEINQYLITQKSLSNEKKYPVVRVLDLCAGSGAIGVAVAKALPEVEVSFGEIDYNHIKTIKMNVEKNIPEYSNRLEYLTSNLFTDVDGVFDFILTNPPYIDPSIDRAEISVKEYEPHLALYGGVKGMEIIENIIGQAGSHLTENGQLWIEHEPEQTPLLQKNARTHDFKIKTHPDQYEIERYSILKR